MFGDGSCDSAEEIGVANLNCSHRGINDRFSGQSIPRKREIQSAFTDMERTCVVELVRPMRAFKVKLPRTLCDPGAIREQRGWVLPIGFDSGFLRLCDDLGVAVDEHLSKLGDTLAVSFYGFGRILVRPIIDTKGCIRRIIEVNGV